MQCKTASATSAAMSKPQGSGAVEAKAAIQLVVGCILILLIPFELHNTTIKATAQHNTACKSSYPPFASHGPHEVGLAVLTRR